jgi:hypothetical protein
MTAWSALCGITGVWTHGTALQTTHRWAGTALSMAAWACGTALHCTCAPRPTPACTARARCCHCQRRATLRGAGHGCARQCGAGRAGPGAGRAPPAQPAGLGLGGAAAPACRPAHVSRLRWGRMSRLHPAGLSTARPPCRTPACSLCCAGWERLLDWMAAAATAAWMRPVPWTVPLSTMHGLPTAPRQACSCPGKWTTPAMLPTDSIWAAGTV